MVWVTEVRGRRNTRKLVPDRITLEPFEEKCERGYRFTGGGTYERLIAFATFGGGPKGLRSPVHSRSACRWPGSLELKAAWKTQRSSRPCPKNV
jgi:hypothetical protein